ncbi:diguanylate cyclase [Bowmanella denitrificans]|uniref:diguanylate cyclase n=1 Tax=Bowmanella denitrificans TaxID=366582 RepID=UPI0011AEFE57|nr:diguanylate cyclase [Bowmanella denitrificans]
MRKPANAALIGFILCWLLSGISTANAQAAKSTHGVPETLRYCVDPDWMPYEALREGLHSGMSSEYLTLVAQQLGIKMELVPTNSWQQTLQKLRDGDCELSPMLNRSQQRDQYLAFSQVYFYAPNVLVARKDQPFLQNFEHVGRRVLAVPGGYRLQEYLNIYYPSIETLNVASERDGLQAVADGQADLFVGSLYSINAYIQQDALADLKIAGWGGPQDELRIGVIHKYAYLLPEINQALSAVTERQHLDIQNRWNNLRIVENSNVRLAWQIGLVTLTAILLLVAWNLWIRRYNLKLAEQNRQLVKLRHELEASNKELQFLSDHDPLTKLHNRHFFNHCIDQDNRDPTQQQSSLILLDIDHFKAVNDGYGHQVGDQILQELAQILRQCVREHDLAARWGGEEFVILCHNADIEDAVALARRIADKVEETSFSRNLAISCSFGIAEVRQHEPMQHCFERADKALYEAKSLGRNRISISKGDTSDNMG